MARGDVRIAVTLACEECKRRNYQTNKSKRNNPIASPCASTAAGAGRTRATGRPASRGRGDAGTASARRRGREPGPRADRAASRERPGRARPRVRRGRPVRGRASSRRRRRGRRRSPTRSSPARPRRPCGDAAPAETSPRPSSRPARARRPGSHAGRLRALRLPPRLLGRAPARPVARPPPGRRRPRPSSSASSSSPAPTSASPTRSPSRSSTSSSRPHLPRESMFRWYVVNTYSGHENKVKQNLEHRVDLAGPEALRAPGRRAHRDRVRDEGQPEGLRREAHDARLRARQHGAQRGLLGPGQGHARA